MRLSIYRCGYLFIDASLGRWTWLRRWVGLGWAGGPGYVVGQVGLELPRRESRSEINNPSTCNFYSTRTYALMCKLGINSHSQIYSYSLGVVYECNFKMCNCRHQPKPSTSMPAAMLKVMSRTTIEGGPRRGGRFFPMRKLLIFRGMPTYELLLLSCA